MARVTGLTFATAKAFVIARGGDVAWQQVRERLSPEDRAVLDEVVAIGWYDVDTQVRLFETILAVLGRPVAATMHDYARFTVARHVDTIFRVLVTRASPRAVLEKLDELWSRFYDSGHWVVAVDDGFPRKARCDLVDFAQPSAWLCEFLGTYLSCLIEHVGAKHVRAVHTHCRRRGEPACTYALEWQ